MTLQLSDVSTRCQIDSQTDETFIESLISFYLSKKKKKIVQLNYSHYLGALTTGLEAIMEHTLKDCITYFLVCMENLVVLTWERGIGKIWKNKLIYR